MWLYLGGETSHYNIFVFRNFIFIALRKTVRIVVKIQPSLLNKFIASRNPCILKKKIAVLKMGRQKEGRWKD